jgi:outer membrane receptor protein involved in Fe transport
VQVSCAAPAFGGGFTSINEAQFMPSVAAARVPSLVRRFVKHKSAYFELEWDVLDTLKVVGEGRFVDEDNKIVGPVTAGSQGTGTVILCGSTGLCTNTAAIPYSIQGAPRTFAGATVLRYDSYTRNDSYFTPKATMQWQPNKNLNIYGSYSRGEKPGGFATLTIGGFGLPPRTDIEFKPERINVYELGAKWAAASRRLEINAALFKQVFTDKQVSSQIIINNNLGNRVTNVPGAVSEGMELSAQWKATQHLTLAAGLTHFFKYDYTDYTTLSSGASEVARVGNCVPVITLNATNTGAASTCQITRNGNKMEDVAATALAFNADWRHAIGANGWTFTADADASYEGKRYIEDDNTIWLDPYWMGNLRFGLETSKATLQIFVDNIADNRKVRSAGSGPANAVAQFRTGIVTGGAPSLALRSVFAPQIPTSLFADMPKPRTVGLRLSYKF